MASRGPRRSIGARLRAACSREGLAAFGRWLRAFVLRHWLPLCFLVATLISLTFPAPGRAVASVLIFGDIHLISTINIIIVFVISGLVLKTEDLKQAVTHWQGMVYGCLAILAVTPCLGFALRELPLTPPEFATGLTIFAAVPTTLGVGEALVRASKGNAALALLLLVSTNSLGIVTMPPWLRLLLSSAQGLASVSVEVLPLFYKLLATVLAPALIGKAARELLPPVRRFATKYKMQLGMFNTLNLACIIWQTLSGAQDVLVHQRFLDILIVICAAVIMHALYLVLNFSLTIWVVRLPLKEAIAASIMSSQKSAPVAVTVISYLTPSISQQGLLAVPCVIGQLAQIFMGAAFAPHLARIVTRREQLAALAAAELPDLEADAAAAAAAAEAGELGAAAALGDSGASRRGSVDGSRGGSGSLDAKLEGKAASSSGSSSSSSTDAGDKAGEMAEVSSAVAVPALAAAAASAATGASQQQPGPGNGGSGGDGMPAPAPKGPPA